MNMCSAICDSLYLLYLRKLHRITLLYFIDIKEAWLISSFANPFGSANLAGQTVTCTLQ
jgi:hypothetical protein